MGKLLTRTVPDVTAQAASDAVNVSDLDSSKWWIQGTFVATADLQISPDGVTFHDVADESLSAPGFMDIPPEAVFARVNVSAFTSGDVESVITGRNEDLKK